MTDRELLELAAKAAGVDSRRLPHAWPVRFDDDQWNPLEDDGDALRLAVTVGLAVIPYPIYAKPKHSVIAKQYSESLAVFRGDSDAIECVEIYGDDPYAATRRAIVRAAAEIGRGLADKPEGK